MDTAAVYQKTYQRFKKDYPDFIGSKMIYAPIRNVDNHTISKYIELAIELKVSWLGFFFGLALIWTFYAILYFIQIISHLHYSFKKK